MFFFVRGSPKTITSHVIFQITSEDVEPGVREYLGVVLIHLKNNC